MAKKTYGERLRELRKRADISGEVLSSKLGFSAPAAYYRYEKITNPKKDAGHRPIPYDIIKGVGIYLVGKGSPPVTWDELLEISSIATLPDELAVAQKSNPRGSAGSASDGSVLTAFAAAQQAKASTGIPVRYTVETDTFMRRTKLEEPSPVTITAPILPSPEYSLSSQYGVRVADESALPVASPGDTLHCVDVGQFSVPAATGRVCLYFAEHSGGLGELLVGRAVVEKDNLVGVDLRGVGKVKGQVIAIVIRKFSEL